MTDDTILGTTKTLLSTNQTMAAEAEAKERDNRRKVADYFRFAETVEETKMMDKSRSTSKPSFVKSYTGNEEEWSDNHFFCRDGNEDETCRVLLTSYQVKAVMENCSRAAFYKETMPIGVNKGKVKDSGFYYIKAQKPFNAVPVQNVPQEGEIFEYLNDLKKNNPHEFDDGCSLESVLEDLSEEDLSEAPEELKRFAKSYRKALVDRDLKQMFEPLYDWQGGSTDKTIYELRLGLGHARKIYSKKNSAERKILNAPLIEVPVDVDEESLKVVPLEGGRLKWNGETKASLLFTGGKNKKVLADFQTLVANGSPTDVILGDPETFLRYVEKASQFCWHGDVKKSTDDFLHQFPEESNALVLTTEWCLFVRPKRSNSISNDAHTIAKAIEEKNMDLSLPCRSLIFGPDDAHSTDSQDTHDGSSFLLPLPASKHQLKVIQKVFKEDNHVTNIQGPPGTGKTQTGLNLASIVLQRGSSCLVTSDNPRALEAFAQKLPPKLAKFCINMSTMEECGVGTLSQTLECREADLAELLEEKDGFEKDIKRLQEEIVSTKKQRDKSMDNLRKRSGLSQKLMKENGFSKLVQRALKGDAEISRVIRSIINHRDVDGLKEGLAKLRDEQRVEKLEPVMFKSDDLEIVTQDLIEFTEKKATPAGPESAGKRRLASTFHSYSRKQLLNQISSFKLHTDDLVREPVSPEDWARVVRGLKLKMSQSSFQKAHVGPLVERGCPETVIYAPDGLMVKQEFIDIVTDVQRSLVGVEPDSLNTLLKHLEDVSDNRKSQESQKYLCNEIRWRQEELVYATIARKQSTSIKSRDLGNFSQLKELASRMKDSEIDTTKASEATSRRKAKFVEKLHKSLRCMPLLLMTTEQVSKYIPVGHRFDLVIADEASQSPSSTALTILARAAQVVVIGDSKQTLPKDDLTEESRSALEKCRGDLDFADLFMPGDGNSLFDVCQSTFPQSNLTLRDHFRCPPEGMSWSKKFMYGGRMNLYKPSGNKATQCLKITKNVKADMAQFVYDLVKETLPSDIDDQVILTIGVIMMGPKREVKCFEESLDNKLTPLENQHGTEAVDRHCIKVATPQDFQGQERDIILIGCVSDTLPFETDPDRKRLWNVATTRHRRQSVIFSRYDIHKIKKTDHKREIFLRYNQPHLHACFKEGRQDIRSMAEDRLFNQLASCGYDASRNKEATIWNTSLCTGLKNGSISNNSALIIIENYGESKDEWSKIVDQQADLEEAGIACLRVDALSLSLCFQKVFDDVVAFLKEKVGLSPRTNVSSNTFDDVSDSMATRSNLVISESASMISDAEPPSPAKQRKRPAGKTSNKIFTSKRRKNH